MKRLANISSSVSKFIFLVFIFILSYSAVAQIDVDEKLALQFYQNKQYEQAAELYREIYALKPTPYYYNYYLNCLFALEDYKEAASFVKSVAKKRPGMIKYKVEAAYVLQRSGNEEKAFKSYEKIIKSMGDYRGDVIELANAFRVRDLNNYALKTYLKAQKKDFETPFNMEIADLYFEMGNYEAMVSQYLNLAEENKIYINVVKAKLQLIIVDPMRDDVSEALKMELLKRSQKNSEEILYADLLYWFSIQKKEFELALIQSKALVVRNKEDGGRIYNLGMIMLSNKEYSLAVDAFQSVIDLGKQSPYYYPAQVEILNAKFKKITLLKVYEKNELYTLEKEYLKRLNDIGRNSHTVEMIMNLSFLQAFYLDKIEDAKTELGRIEEMKNISRLQKAKAKLSLADMKLFSGEKWSASLLYKQVEKDFKNEPIGYEAKFKAAKFFYYVGEMEWAKSQLKVLGGATSKLIANDALDLYLLIADNISFDSTYYELSMYAKADLLHFQKQYAEANLILDTLLDIFPNHPVIDDVLFKKAVIAQEKEDYKLADSLYKRTLDYKPFGPYADNALIERARINDYKLVKPDIAKQLYKKVLIDYPGSLFTIEARRRYREMEKGEL